MKATVEEAQRIPEAKRRGEEEEEGEHENKEEEEEEEEQPLHEWDFSLSTVVSSPIAAGATISDTLGVVEIDPSDLILATAGIARKIRIYSLSLLVGEDPEEGERTTTCLDNARACSYYICTPAKLSSLRWRPDSGGRVAGCGDYDGVVTEYDLERRVAVFERDEHGGRRVWSVDYSHQHSLLGASGSDDGTAQLWDPRCVGVSCTAAARPGSPVCCVEFDPAGGAGIAIGSADRRAYLYDVRNMSAPVLTFSGHRRTVTYVRFLPGREAMVSSGTDGCLRMWALPDGRPVQTYRGHVNKRSFVGLAVWRGGGGLMGCGSESNEVVVYDPRWSRPVWVGRFGPQNQTGGFVSSVCWRQRTGGEGRCTLLAGGSDGVLQVFDVRKRKPSL